MADINLSDILSTTTGTTTNISPSTPATDAALDLHPSTGAIQSSINFYQDDGTTLVAGMTATAAGGLNIYSPVNLSLQGLYWPASDGIAGQVLTTDGAGNLSWQSGANNILNTSILASLTSTIDSVSVTNLKSVKWLVTVENVTLSKITSYEVLAHNRFGTSVDYNIYSRIGNNNLRHGVAVVIAGGFMNLNITNNEIHTINVSINKIIIGG